MKAIEILCLLCVHLHRVLFEYECVYYDDDDHALYDIQGFADLRMSNYKQLVRL